MGKWLVVVVNLRAVVFFFECKYLSNLLFSTATFTAEPPAPHLYSFTGKMQLGEEEISISQEQLFLRGASLRNTGLGKGQGETFSKR